MIGEAHALTLAAQKQWALFFDEPNIECRFLLAVLSGKGDKRKEFLIKLLDQARALPYISVAF